MEKLQFNTKTKRVVLTRSTYTEFDAITYNNVHTVKPGNGYYEVLQKDDSGKIYPVLRVPISNTIMTIEHE
jgi:hypothetical protein